MHVIDVILVAGRSVVELALFLLLPIMVVMLSVMRILERMGVLHWVVLRCTPLLAPFGLSGLSVFAMLQVSLVSFAAPIATLLVMEQRGVAARQMAATLAMVLAMGQANVLFPLSSAGLQMGPTLLWSVLGGLVAAATTYYGFARGHAALAAPSLAQGGADAPPAPASMSYLQTINQAGRDAIQIALGIIPMVLLALVVVTLLRDAGGVLWLQQQLAPLLHWGGIDVGAVVPAVTKYLAGGTAVLGVLLEAYGKQEIDASFLNTSAGWLINSLDVPGVAILVSASPMLAKLWKPAVLGALIGITVRALGHTQWT